MKSDSISSCADTIVALSSGRPPAAVAIIRISGQRAQVAAEAIAGSLPASRQSALRTLRHPESSDPLDTALVLSFDAPGSVTGEDTVEFQCHGGRAVVAAILDALTSLPGTRLAEPGEFTRRALANGRIDLTEAEGLADLLEAETEQQRRAALSLVGGALSRQVEAWQSRVLDLSAQAEATIDYVGDEQETSIDFARLVAEAQALADELDEWLARPRAEPLKDGIRVVIAGPPNVGKSSLINALAGSERALVTEIAGTTRDTIEVPLSVGGIPLLLVDTAGLRNSDDHVERLGVERARAEAGRAEILLWLGHAHDMPDHPHAMHIHPKADLDPPSEPGTALPISSRTGDGLAELLAQIAGVAATLLPAEGSVALNRRQAATIRDAADALRSPPVDVVIFADLMRSARLAFDRLTGRASVEEALDALFGRFCLGK